ncbi:serpin family protein [Amphibacillus sp. MSJ-3]|uniref:serpin family protein n=1 Tax=Amphibacillus sp. MSJ-3 TaxID=2841505 RepID=UPI001C0EA996|nr:serpin family protein [Amphibacillus sp. MSJ-3]MBU5593861.1 serpin family protein [Amphibacillus sp. MSJ-3]
MKKMSVIALFVLLLTACGTADQAPIDQDDDSNVSSSENIDQTIIDANNQLGFDLLSTIESDENGNTFISPTSLFMALSMVYNGADGETRQEMVDTLQLDEIEGDQLNQANASLLAIMNDDSRQAELKMGNSIWLNQEFQFQNDFLENNQHYYHAEMQEIGVADGKSADQINKWVSEATNEKIDQIVDVPLNPDIVAMLINAVYFQGTWTYPFDENRTEEHAFHLEDGSTKNVPLMTLKKNFMYMENGDFQAISLPYGDDEEMSMQIFLPNEDKNIADLQDNLTNKDWKKWKSEFQEQEGTIMLPKFQLEFEASLSKALESLGMKTAFDERQADFSKMVEEDVQIWISEVKQKTFIDVNEEGTEAAGTTSVDIVTTSAQIDPPFEMKVDRPFFMTITDEKTGALLFMGTILNP